MAHHQEIKDMVLAVFEESEQRCGADKILAVLTERGIHTSKKLILMIMREEGVQSIGLHAKKDYKTFSKKQNAVQGQFRADVPNSSEKEFRESVASYIQFYNEKRPHRYNKYRTPMQAEEGI